jgi:hypothetical protein
MRTTNATVAVAMLMVGCLGETRSPSVGHGGMAGAGGSAPDSGGSSATGGLFDTGGTTTTGGQVATGGVIGTGGNPSAGAAGSPATGGASGVSVGGPDPIGTGWTEYFPQWIYHVPPNADGYGERYTYQDGVFHLWVLDTDQSTFPGNDSGPRSEVRVQNDYTSGSRQFQADVRVVSGAEKVGIWQLFFRPYPWMVRVYDGEFRQYGNGSTFATVPFDTTHRFNAIHSTATRTLEIYLDGVQVLRTTLGASDGSVPFYNKFGVYGRDGMGASNEIYYSNVHYFSRD